MGTRQRENTGGTQSIERALALLRALATRGRFGWTLSELAAAAGLKKTTAHRILGRLEQERLIHRRDGGDRYVLGPGLGELSLCVPGFHEFVSRARAHGASLGRKLSLVTIVSLRSGDHFVLAARTASAHMATHIHEEGSYRPLISTAGGIAILITLPAALQDRIIGANVRELALRGRTQLAHCHSMLKRSRTLGVGANFGDMAAGTNAVAVPFGDTPEGAIGSLTVAGPESQLDQARCLALVPLLREQAQPLTQLARQVYGGSSHIAASLTAASPLR
ncbi:helix-turn-helix domain-containing protein [Ramlibacter sp. AW1]|uniref:Helix-turn-helix domain-containing protein n=1 Tax=Ramlibacter aurantiacus TaxID=2801330 RepID=A0A936ZKA1_9BURK|nr:helix-turn-helix domain-containing protein [Ramlibacter aurantiacus]MBL0419281.1 helix-turn-helix domain-containing protein [Ramlibacter aurantiacus]